MKRLYFIITLLAMIFLSTVGVFSLEDGPEKVSFPSEIVIHVGESVHISPVLTPRDASTDFSIISTRRADNVLIVIDSNTISITGLDVVENCSVQFSTSNGITFRSTIRVIDDTYQSSTVYFDSNGGEWVDGGNSHRPLTLIANVKHGYSGYNLYSEYYLNRPGYMLIGWNSKSDYSGDFYSLDYVLWQPSVEDGAVFFAQWLEIPYKRNLILDTHFGNLDPDKSGLQQTQFVVLDMSSTIVLPEVYREGYEFVAWEDGNDINDVIENEYVFVGGVKLFSSNSEYFSNNNVLLTAQWISNDSPSTVFIFDSNGAKTSYEYTDIEIGFYYSTFNFSNRILYEKEGAVQVGWNTSADGSGMHYGFTEEFSVSTYSFSSKIVYFYAEWEVVELPDHYVILCGNGYKFSDGTDYVIIDRDNPVTMPELFAEDKEFCGWLDNKGFNGWDDSMAIYPASSILPAYNCVLYPYFRSIESKSVYFVSLFANEGTFIGFESFNGYIDTSCIPICLTDAHTTVNLQNIIASGTDLLKRNGYEFIGWNTCPDGSGTNYSVNEIPLTDSKCTAYYAQWEDVSISRGQFGDSIIWAETKHSFDIEIKNCGAKHIWLASYDLHGRFIGFEQQEVKDNLINYFSVDLTKQPECKISLFFLDSKDIPQNESITCK